MPEQSGAERTEEATPRRRQQARERGNVARSKDLAAALMLFSAALFFRYAGGAMLHSMVDVTGSLIEASVTTPVTDSDLQVGILLWIRMFVEVVAPFLLTLCVVAAVVNFAQVGFMVSWESIMPKLDKLNPVNGFMRLFSMRSLVTLIMSLAKVMLVLVVAWVFFQGEFAGAGAVTALSAREGFAHCAQVTVEFMTRLSATLLIIAILDYAYQRFQHERDLRMTKQEVIEEMKDTDGDPHIRQRRRQVQRELAQQRMMASVPEAEVVVRNPDHYAVALAYDVSNNVAPMVVAKGTDLLALRIVAIAEEHGVPCVRNPDLARKLYARVEVDESVPENLWVAVAEVLAMVYRQNERARERAAALT